MNSYLVEVLDPDYMQFSHMFAQMTLEQAKDYALELGVQVYPHPNEIVYRMRIKAAVIDKKGLKKYKSQYASREERDKLYQKMMHEEQ